MGAKPNVVGQRCLLCSWAEGGLIEWRHAFRGAFGVSNTREMWARICEQPVMLEEDRRLLDARHRVGEHLNRNKEHPIHSVFRGQRVRGGDRAGYRILDRIFRLGLFDVPSKRKDREG